MNLSKSSNLKTTIRLFVKRHRKAVIAGVAVLIAFILGQCIYWLATSPNNIQVIGMAKNARLDSQYQVNIFVAPDWLIGIDGGAKQVKYLRLGEDIDPQQIVVTAKKRHILIDAYVIFDNNLEEIEDLPGQLMKGLLSGNVSTDFSRLDLLKLWSSVRGNVVYQPQHGDSLIEDAVQNEHLSIGIFNATKITGLASEASLWIENIGGKVVEVGNSSSHEAKTSIEIYTDKKQASAIAKRLTDIFGVGPKYVQAGDMKFDVKVIVGADFIE